MSATREIWYRRENRPMLTGIAGLVLLLVGLIFHPGFVVLAGVFLFMSGVDNRERGIRGAIVGVLLITFGLIFNEPFRAMIGCIMALISLVLWRSSARDQSTATGGSVSKPKL